jgi:hypothetical protein
LRVWRKRMRLLRSDCFINQKVAKKINSHPFFICPNLLCA